MTWARSASKPDENGRFAVVQAAYKVTCETQSRRAARIVASHSCGTDEEPCMTRWVFGTL
jgi:hypothetical protein